MSHRSGPKSGSQPVAFGRRRRSDAERNRAALLDAARSLLRDRHLASVTMDEVAAAAGVGKGTLFRAFGDKG
ncbi:MAG: TetR/AcrR family transcriptional regulator, partial [Actinomycetota bacterium]|nr:TetR/AcrR family transcriptional regulator [Actinomycetota bacterium]